MTNINISLPRGYKILVENSLVACRDFQQKLLYKLAETKPLFFAEAVAQAQSKASIDAKGIHCCLLDVVKVESGKLGETITDENFVITDSMKIELSTMVQPIFLDNHMTVNVIVIRVHTK